VDGGGRGGTCPQAEGGGFEHAVWALSKAFRVALCCTVCCAGSSRPCLALALVATTSVYVVAAGLAMVVYAKLYRHAAASLPWSGPHIPRLLVLLPAARSVVVLC
jgi:hypothetical protein